LFLSSAQNLMLISTSLPHCYASALNLLSLHCANVRLLALLCNSNGYEDSCFRILGMSIDIKLHINIGCDNVNIE
jgi:hypothetical protein